MTDTRRPYGHNRSEQVRYRVSPSEKALIEAVSKLEGRTMSRISRELVLDYARRRFRQAIQDVATGGMAQDVANVPEKVLTG